MSTIPSDFYAILLSLQPLFSAPSFVNFQHLVCGWLLCPQRRSIAQVVRVSGSAKHFASFYRFFSRAVWSTDALGRVLFGMARAIHNAMSNEPLTLIVDDTLSRRTGPRFWGAGMHYDGVRSSYGRGKGGRHVELSFGHSWVVLALWMPLPFRNDRGVAVPVLWRLYRPKKHCLEGEYAKRTELAHEMVSVAREWIGDEPFMLLGDQEYACQTLLRDQNERLGFIGPMSMKAAFWDRPREQRRLGRPRLKGERLHSPKQLIEDASTNWRTITVDMYGKSVTMNVKTQEGLWYRVFGTRIVRMVVTRDPSGRLQDRAFVCTDLSLSVSEALAWYAKRWSLEVTFREAKQDLGLEQPQNGWWRRPAGAPRAKKAGPQPHKARGRTAILHTVPFVLAIHSLVHIWYAQHGDPIADAARVRSACPWYRHKNQPSFTDMIGAWRRAAMSATINQNPHETRITQKQHDWLLQLACGF